MRIVSGKNIYIVKKKRPYDLLKGARWNHLCWTISFFFLLSLFWGLGSGGGPMDRWRPLPFSVPGAGHRARVMEGTVSDRSARPLILQLGDPEPRPRRKVCGVSSGSRAALRSLGLSCVVSALRATKGNRSSLSFSVLESPRAGVNLLSGEIHARKQTSVLTFNIVTVLGNATLESHVLF